MFMYNVCPGGAMEILVTYKCLSCLNYLTSQQCCDSENESWNMRVKNTVEIV